MRQLLLVFGLLFGLIVCFGGLLFLLASTGYVAERDGAQIDPSAKIVPVIYKVDAYTDVVQFDYEGKRHVFLRTSHGSTTKIGEYPIPTSGEAKP